MFILRSSQWCNYAVWLWYAIHVRQLLELQDVNKLIVSKTQVSSDMKPGHIESCFFHLQNNYEITLKMNNSIGFMTPNVDP